jgi:hypothetical protein
LVAIPDGGLQDVVLLGHLPHGCGGGGFEEGFKGGLEDGHFFSVRNLFMGGSLDLWDFLKMLFHIKNCSSRDADNHDNFIWSNLGTEKI